MLKRDFCKKSYLKEFRYSIWELVGEMVAAVLIFALIFLIPFLQ